MNLAKKIRLRGEKNKEREEEKRLKNEKKQLRKFVRECLRALRKDSTYAVVETRLYDDRGSFKRAKMDPKHELIAIRYFQLSGYHAKVSIQKRPSKIGGGHVYYYDTLCMIIRTKYACEV